MMSRQSMIPVVVIAAITSGLRAGDDVVPAKLTPETYGVIKARVDVKPEDLAWQQVRWRDGFFEGLLDAQAEDKPIFFWFYTGDPRGHC